MEQPKKGFLYSVGKNLNVGPWKRMWMEIPHIPFFGIQAIIAASIGLYYAAYIHKEEIGLQNKFTVMRSDDPRVKLFKKEMVP